MRRVALIVSLFVTGAAFAADPAASLAEAKSQLAAKQYGKAVEAAKAGLEGVGAIADEGQRKAALTALNFYAAAAAAGTGDMDASRGYIEEFLKLSPNTRRLDPTKFDAKFVALFDVVANPASGDDMFSSLYPGFSTTGHSSDETALALIDAAAVDLLGTKAEKKEWRAVEDSAGRQTFLESFWSKRDQDPATPQNEYRERMSRRIAFANTAFATRTQRGALTDRGRVFVLLGRPAFVRRRPINKTDASRSSAWK